MQHPPVRLDAARAWTDAMAMLKAAPDLLLTVAGFFIMLPSLFLDLLRPMNFSGQRGRVLVEMVAWTEANLPWIMIASVIAALGRLMILIMLVDGGRPTAGESLQAGVRLLLMFVLMDLLIGLLWMGGLMVFILPGLYVVGRTFLAETAFVATRAGNPVAAITAGFEASRGNGWRIFAMVAIIYIAGMILSAAVSSVVGVVGALSGIAGLDRFLVAFVEAGIGAGISLVLLLVSVSSWRQLAENRDVRGRALR